jgi:hypothetical protein
MLMTFGLQGLIYRDSVSHREKITILQDFYVSLKKAGWPS